MDQAAQDYFRAVEQHFIERRGRSLILSPGDVARVAEWHAKGIPQAAVLEAIDVHFERMARRGREPRRAVTLAYLEDEVLDAWAGARRRRLGRPVPKPGGAGEGEAGPVTHLATRQEHQRLLDALDAATASLQSGSELMRALAVHVLAAREKLAGKASLFDETAAAHDDERAEDHLRRLERGLLQHAREHVGPDGVARLAEEAARTLGDKASRMNDKARERAMVQLVDRSLRELLGIPRLSLFYA